MPVLVFVLAAVAVAAVVDPRLWRHRMSADRMADCTQKLQATISAAVESSQTGFNSLIVQHVRFFWFDRCSTRCDLFNLVPRCPISRCQVSRFLPTQSTFIIRNTHAYNATEFILYYCSQHNSNYTCKNIITQSCPVIKIRLQES